MSRSESEIIQDPNSPIEDVVAAIQRRNQREVIPKQEAAKRSEQQQAKHREESIKIYGIWHRGQS